MKISKIKRLVRNFRPKKDLNVKKLKVEVIPNPKLL